MKKYFNISLIVLFIICSFNLSSVFADYLLNQEKLEQMDNLVIEDMERFNVPGMSLVVVNDGKILFSKGYGVKELGTEVKVDADTIIGLASVSKAFTNLAIMQLRDQGLLNLNDPITKYLPWFRSKDKENSNKITMLDLIRHTSGIPTNAYGLEIENGTADDLEEQVKLLSTIELTSTPGTRFQYSNMNYWTLALIAEKLTGMKFSEYMEQNIFEPLEMAQTGYYDKVSKLENFSKGHIVRYAKPKVSDYNLPEQENAAGGLYSTANDMGNYLIGLLNDGTYNGKTILSKDSIVEMRTNGFEIGENYFYGYGWNLQTVNDTYIVHHGGDNPNFTAHVYLFPENNFGFALLSNSAHPMTHYVGYNLKNIILEIDPRQFNLTGAEMNAKNATLANYATLGIIAIILIWLLIVLLGMKKGKYVFTSKRPGIVRLILQVILVPLIGAFIGVFALSLPIQMIGSYHVAFLYQGDFVGSVVRVVITFMVFTVFVGFMAFIRKPKDNSSTRLKNIVNSSS
ncbi:MAG: beta-lactamase family protein [Halanaerobiales bacterium]|nr:beta-lactamase family protein [Halanaerobiales bacterium]